MHTHPDFKQLPLRATTILENFALSKVTYFKIGGTVRYFLQVRSSNDLILLLNYLLDHAVPYYLFGGMTNILFAWEDFPGIVIQYLADKIEIKGQTLIVEAGAKMVQIAEKTIASGLAGLAQFQSLPGTVGGAIFNNAHYGQTLVGDYLEKVLVFDTKSKTVKTLTKDDLQLDYDQSIFHRLDYVILQATFKLPKGDQETLQKIADETKEKRLSSQPLSVASAGCYFQNPELNGELKAQFPDFANLERISAGLLIDKCGLKGKNCGGAKVSEKHASFLTNVGDASAKDVLTLAELIKEQVKEKFGVQLKEEVVVIKNNK